MQPLEPWRIIVQLIAVPLLLIYCLVRGRTDLRLIALCIVAISAYGMIQDQFSVRLSREYFTIGHPPIEGLHDPTLLGVAWGFLGGWWGGMLMGMALGLTATVGKRPALTIREVLPGLICLLLAIVAGTILAGTSAWYNGSITQIHLGGNWADAIPAERHLRFFIVACAHFGTYLAAVSGTIVLCLWVGRERRRKAAMGENLVAADVSPTRQRGFPQTLAGASG